MSGITRPAHFLLNFKAGLNIGDMWYGSGLWDAPAGVPITPNMASAGKWDTMPTITNLTSYALSAGEDDTQYGYNFATVLNWGEFSGGGSAEDWQNTKDKIDERCSWIWGNVVSGLGLVKTGSQYYFLATYGLYSDGTREKILATASQPLSLTLLTEGAFTWFTNISSQDPYTGSTWGDGIGAAVCWTHSNYGASDIIIYQGYHLYIDVVVPYIEFFTETNRSLSDTLDDTWVSTILGGHFPARVTELNSIASPYAGGTGPCYYPDIYAGDGWQLIAGGPFNEGQDSSGDSSKTPADSGGGNGNYDNSSDPIDFPDESQFAIDALNTGLITVFNPTKDEVIDFASFLYSDSITDAIANQLKRLLADPLDYIISLNMAHFKPETSGTNTINFGGVSTDISAEVVDPQIQFIDCGEINIAEQTNSFQDYQMSKISLYLPYCGIHEISVTEAMAGKMWIQYAIDTISGSCVANVRIRRHRSIAAGDPDLDAILYSFTGNCFQSVPLTSRDFKSTIQSLLTVAGAAGTIATAGIGGAAGTGGAIGGLLAGGASAGKAAAGSLGTVTNAAMNATPSVSRIGNYSSNFGYMQKQKPYLILERPVASVPSSYEGFYGRPLYSNLKLSQCWGYTEVDTNTLWIEAEGFEGITQEEEDMLKAQLNADGIYIDHENDYANYEP